MRHELCILTYQWVRGHANYSSAKMAVIGLTQTVSHELKMSHEVCIDFDKKIVQWQLLLRQMAVIALTKTVSHELKINHELYI